MTEAEPGPAKTPRYSVMAPLKTLAAKLAHVSSAFANLLRPVIKLAAALKNVPTTITKLATLVKRLPIPKTLPGPFRTLPIPKKLLIPALAAVGLLVAGGAFAVFHGKANHMAQPQTKAVTVAAVVSTPAPAAACSGVIRDIYRQTVEEDPSVSLAEVRSEVASTGISCAPVPEITVQLKTLSPGCRDMVQYTYLEVRDGHPDITVNDIRDKVVKKSVACEHDRTSNVAAVTRQRTK